MQFPASEIKAATDNFNVRHLVGEGGFGRVYRAHAEAYSFSY